MTHLKRDSIGGFFLQGVKRCFIQSTYTQPTYCILKYLKVQQGMSFVWIKFLAEVEIKKKNDVDWIEISLIESRTWCVND